MTKQIHTPKTRRRKRRRHDRTHGEGSGGAVAPATGATRGTPRYLKAQSADISSSAEHEARSIGAQGGKARAKPQETPLGQAAASVMSSERAQGAPLDPGARALAERKQGEDFSDVRVHTNSPLAAGIGANAITYSGDIHFAPGAYNPGSAQGDALIGHELAHVVQQRSNPGTSAQFDIQGSHPVTHGLFEIDMTTAATTAGGMGERGTVEFKPKDTAPYTARLGLVQAIAITQATGVTEDPEDHMGPPAESGVSSTAQADLQQLHTQGNEGPGVDGGWRIDARTIGSTVGDASIGESPAAVQPGRGREPFYQDSWHTAGSTQYGWVRGPGDVRSTKLWDHPNWRGADNDFDFETAAVGADNATVYGVLKWGFHLENGQVTRPYARALDTQSATFDAAMQKFRDYYAHEPIIVYFDTNSDVPGGTEQAKVDQAITYLNAHPDMDVTMSAYADHRGSADYNADLAIRRSMNIESQMTAAGIDSGRIWSSGGDTETSMFGDTGALRNTAGNLQANRRVVMSFRRRTP